MNDHHHVIWSNRDLDYDDWKDDLEAEYPDLSDNERYALMYEINNGYLEDERVNLDISLLQLQGLLATSGLDETRTSTYLKKIIRRAP